MTITIDTVHLVLAVIGIVGALAANAWGIIRFLINRLDAQRADLAAMIDGLRHGVVMRPEYEREIQRLHSEITGLRQSVEQYGNSQAARIDALVIALRNNKI